MNTLVKPDPNAMQPQEFRAFVIRNLQRAIQIMQAVPTEHVNLDSFKCGSTACLAGWLCSDPYFAQWMVLAPRKHTIGATTATREKHPFMLTRRKEGMDMTVPVMGLSEFSDLFGADSDLFRDSYGEPQGNHKAIALNRLYSHLKMVEAKKDPYGGVDLMEDKEFQELSLELLT